MLDKFIEFTHSLFPSIDPYTKEHTKDAIKQFQDTGRTINYLNFKPFGFLAQGDILDGIMFVRLNNVGEIEAYSGKGMIISNTCSADHDEAVLIAPLFKISDLGLKVDNIKSNLHFRLFYLPDDKYSNYVVDFSMMNTFNKSLLTNMINEKKINKESSLNQMGFYLLIAKLTVCFMRPEDRGVQNSRRCDFLRQH